MERQEQARPHPMLERLAQIFAGRPDVEVVRDDTGIRRITLSPAAAEQLCASRPLSSMFDLRPEILRL